MLKVQVYRKRAADKEHGERYDTLPAYMDPISGQLALHEFSWQKNTVCSY